MISVLMSEGVKQDSDLVTLAVRDLLASSGDESLNIICWDMQQELDNVLEQVEKLEAAILDVTVNGGIEAAKQLRREYPGVEIAIISDGTISPITYLNPEVRPASLLLKPLNMENVKQTLLEFFGIFEEEEKEGYMLVERKGEKLRIPYQKIIYMEARDKRVYARMNNIEYGISDTIDHLAGILPEEFVRCHRSFIVNYIYIEKVRYSENYIALVGKIRIPLSRTYKTILKEVMKSGA